MINNYKMQIIMKNAIIDWYLEEQGINKTVADIQIIWYSGYDLRQQAILKADDNLLFECAYVENKLRIRIYESTYYKELDSRRFNSNVEF